MRIVCTVTNDLAQDQRMDRICTSLVRAGHEVTLVGRLLPDSKPLPDKGYRQHRIRCRHHGGKRFYAEYNYRLVREIKGWSYDAVCAVDLDTLLAGVRLTAGGRAKLVFDAHEWFSETPEVVGRPLVRGLWRGLGKALVPKTDARYTVAPMLAERLAEDYGVPFRTVRNLPSPAPASPPEKPDYLPRTDRKVILYQGMLNPGRGLPTAINALGGLPACDLWLVGSGPEENALRILAEKAGVADRVWFAGFRPPPELPAITARAWLGLNLLDAVSPSYYYSLANKSLDYVQAGLPSVQMDFPEYVALQKQYGCFLLIDRLEPVRLGIAVSRLLENEKEHEALRRGCDIAAKQLTWEQEEVELLDIWKNL